MPSSLTTAPPFDGEPVECEALGYLISRRTAILRGLGWFSLLPMRREWLQNVEQFARGHTARAQEDAPPMRLEQPSP